MNDENVITQEQSTIEQQPASVEEQPSLPRRGRPRMEVKWPDQPFTFSSLLSENVLSTSSLRKKMRAKLIKGELVKVDTLKTAFGRPKDVYQKA